MSNPIKKLLGQTAIYGLSSIISRSLNFLLVPIYLYFFTEPKDYGVVSQLYAYVAFLNVFLTFGMETAYFRFIQDEQDEQKVFNTGFQTMLGINLLFFILLILGLNWITNDLLIVKHSKYVVMMGLIVVLDACSALPLAKLRVEEKAKKFAQIQFLSIGINIVLNLLLLFFFADRADPSQGVMMILIANLVSSAIKPLLLIADFTTLRLQFDRVLFKRMLWYGFPIVLAGLAGIINEVIDRILLKQILSAKYSVNYADAQIGIYSACYKLAMLVTIVLQAYRYAAEPFFFSQKNNPDRNKLYVKMMNYFVAFVCLMFLAVSLNLDIFKYFITSKSYWEGLKIVPVLLLANVFLGIYLNQSVWYKLSNRTIYGAYISGIGALITILINLLFIPKFGYVASAWATLIVYATQMTLSYFWGQKKFPINYNRRKFALYIGAALCFYVVCYFLDSIVGNGFIRFILHNGFVLIFCFMVLKIEGIELNKIRLRKK